MEINLSLSPAPSIASNYLVVAIYEASSPAVVIDFQAFAAPHTSARNVTFSNVNPVVHIVKIFENATAAVGGTVRHNFIYNPSFKNAEVRDDLFLIVDQTTGLVSGTTTYVATTLEGWGFSLERRGFGTMNLNVDYKFNDPVDLQPNTITLLATVDNPTPEFQPNEIYVVHFQPKITTVQALNSNSLKLFDEVEFIDADTALDNTYVGKCIWVAGANPSLVITLPDITTVLANKLMPFIFQGGVHVNVSVQCYGTDQIQWLGGNLTELVAGQSEQFWLFKWVDPNNSSIYHWKVMNPDGHFKTVGEIIDIYKDTNVLNCLYAAGQLVSRTTYKRLWNHVLTLDASMLVSDADWNNVALNNKAKYSTGDGSTTFRVKQLYSTGFLRAVNSGTRKAGSFEAAMVLDHRHEQTVGKLPSSLWGFGLISRLIGFYGTSGNQKPDLTSSPTKTDGSAISTGSENRPDNTGVYKLIRI